MNLITLLSAVWILSLPFYHFSLVGSLSLDNIVGPVLFVLTVGRIFISGNLLSRRQIANIALTCALVLIYLLTHALNLIGTQEAVWTSVYGIAKNMLYFLLPILLVVHERDLERLSAAMMLVMIIGSVSALFSALGLISFEFTRQAESRLQLEYIPKSVGLFTAYGDMALLIALALLLALSAQMHVLRRPGIRWLVGLVIFIMALISFASMQSRNMVFTVFVALMVYFFVGRWRKRGGAWKVRFYAVLLSGIVAVVSAVVLFSGPLIHWVENIGGTSEAADTVQARLEQYRFGWDLVSNRILIGADPVVYEQNELAISFIHNMWLKQLVQSGLVGILTILLIYHRALWAQLNRLQADASSVARVYIAVLIGSLIASQFYPGDTPVFWVIMGLATALPQRQTEGVAVAVAAPPPVRERNGLLLARRRSIGR